MLYTAQNSFSRSDSNQHVPDYTAAQASVQEEGKQTARPLLESDYGSVLWAAQLKKNFLPLRVALLATSSPLAPAFSPLLLLLTWLWPLSELCTHQFNSLSVRGLGRKISL